MSQSPTQNELKALSQALKMQELERANKEKAKEVLMRIQSMMTSSRPVSSEWILRKK